MTWQDNEPEEPNLEECLRELANDDDAISELRQEILEDVQATHPEWSPRMREIWVEHFLSTELGRHREEWRGRL